MCPFAVITRGANRQSIEFEAESQDEAIAEPWASLDELRDNVDLWAMAREGLLSTSSGKFDALVVAAWGCGMPEATPFVQRFIGRGETFRLAGPVEVQSELSPDELSTWRRWFHEGINTE